jgi:ribonuclease P protein component
LKRADFRRVYEEGRRLQSPSFSVVCLWRQENEERPLKGPRVGLTVPRALGNAVNRNRLKRRMREAIRLELWRLEGRWDLVFHPKRTANETPMPLLRREMERIFSRCTPPEL